MGGAHEQFISEEDEELKRIRDKKMAQFKARKEMSGDLINITDATFNETVEKSRLVLVDFWAPWCGPCRVLGPIIEELNRDFAGKVLVGKLNVDENPETAERFQVFSIPTVLIMRNGEEVERIVGCVPKKHIETALQKHIG